MGLAFSVALAQEVTTVITPDGTLGTEVTPNGDVHDITGGTSRGGNLFHSFDRFDVGAGDTALFHGPDGTVNIVGRVTGGDPSDIYGTVSSDIPGANLFLLNPAGVMFGPDARVDVMGSFYVSTADELHFSDDTYFSAHLGNGGTLSMASPVAFGFLRQALDGAVRERPAAITLDGANLNVSPGETVSLVGGDITMRGGSLLAPGGTVQVARVALPQRERGTVPLALAGVSSDHGLDDFDALGAIELSGSARLDTTGNGGGTIVIRSGRLVVQQASLTAFNPGSADSPGIGIDIDVRDTLRLSNGTIATRSTGAGNGGDVVIRGGDVILTDNALINTRSGGRRSGEVGDIDVMADHVMMSNNASIFSATVGSGVAAGTVRIEASGTISIVDRNGDSSPTGIFTFSDPSAEPGRVEIVAGRLEMDGGAVGTPRFSNFDRLFPGARSGRIVVDVDHLHLTGGARIDSSTSGSEDAGTVVISANEAVLSDGATISTGTTGDGNAGDIEIEVARLTLTSGAQITTGSGRVEGDAVVVGNGRGGAVRIRATETIVISGTDSSIRSDTRGSGQGGIIRLDAPDIQLTDGALISAESFAAGDAGQVQIDTQTLSLRDSAIATDAAEANGGDITITSRSVRLKNSSITATVRGGKGGNIRFLPNDSVVVLENSEIVTEAGQGQGGDISIGGLAADANSRVSASSELGIDGQVDGLTAVNLGSVTPLPQNFAPELTLFDEFCAQDLRGGQISSFVVAGRDGLPADPSGGLPSSIIEMAEGRRARADNNQDRLAVVRLREAWAHYCAKQRRKAAMLQSAR